MRTKMWAAAAMLAVVGSSTIALGEEKKEVDIGSFSANVGIFSDYTYRGVSQTGQEPALQGGLDWAHDIGFYAGAWGSNVDFSDGDEAHLRSTSMPVTAAASGTSHTTSTSSTTSIRAPAAA